MSAKGCSWGNDQTGDLLGVSQAIGNTVYGEAASVVIVKGTGWAGNRQWVPAVCLYGAISWLRSFMATEQLRRCEAMPLVHVSRFNSLALCARCPS